ncbi:cupredoxin domain-containing protein [Candidatus Daviesbacteria bacterium]|nr:cupredoxin domain-containing protein [Candidatus Daviesbacteria bacterium]
MNKKIIIGPVVVASLVLGIWFIFRNIPNSTVPNQTSATNPQVTPEATIQATAPASLPTQQQNTITLTSSGFSPTTLTIKAGDKVTWINKSSTSATVNSSPHPAHTDYSPLNLGSFVDGETLSLTFDKAGTYKYHNHFNASQFGSIIVQ